MLKVKKFKKSQDIYFLMAIKFSLIMYKNMIIRGGVKEATYIRVNQPSLNKDGGRYKFPKVYDPILGSHVRKICDLWSGLPVSWGRSKIWPKIRGMSKFLCWDHGFRLNIYYIYQHRWTFILTLKWPRYFYSR